MFFKTCYIYVDTVTFIYFFRKKATTTKAAHMCKLLVKFMANNNL